MSDTTPPSTTTAPTAADWLNQFRSAIAEYRAESPALRKLRDLRASIPPGPEAFEALAGACAVLGARFVAPDPDGTGDRLVSTVQRFAASSDAATVSSVLSALVATARQRLEAREWGANPPVRVSDFQQVMETFDQGLVGLQDTLPAGHPGRAIPPLVLRGTRVLLLAPLGAGERIPDVAQRWEFLSEISHRTAVAVEYAERDRAAKEREDARQLERERAAYENTAEALAERVRKLEQARSEGARS